MHFEPVFGAGNLTPATALRLHDLYKFLTDRGEAFEEGFPEDRAKWLPLWEMLRMTYYTEGEGWVGRLYVRRRIASAAGLCDRFWEALEAGDIAAVGQILQTDPTLVNLPHKDNFLHGCGHFPLTLVAANGDLHLLRFLLMWSAQANVPGMCRAVAYAHVEGAG
jgi:hypothetical protein